jgi:hypothetical protein
MVISPILVTILGAAGGGAIKLLFSYFTKKLEEKKWAKSYDKAGETVKAGSPDLVFQPLAAPQPPPMPQALHPSFEAEQQSTRVKQVLIEADLISAQQALRRLRKSLDDAEIELTQKTGALVEARSMYEAEAKARAAEVRAHAETKRVLAETIKAATDLKKEYERSRMEGSQYEPRNRSDVADDRGVRVHRGDPDRRVLPPPNLQGPRKGR